MSFFCLHRCALSANPRITPAEISRYRLIPMSVLLISRQPMKLQISFGFARAMPTTNPRTGMLWKRDCQSQYQPNPRTGIALGTRLRITKNDILPSVFSMPREVYYYVITLTSYHRIIVARKNKSFPGSFLCLANFTITTCTDETYTDAELARVSVLTLDVTQFVTPTVYASACGKRLASVMKNFNKKIDRKNLNFGNKTAI